MNKADIQNKLIELQAKRAEKARLYNKACREAGDLWDNSVGPNLAKHLTAEELKIERQRFIDKEAARFN